MIIKEIFPTQVGIYSLPIVDHKFLPDSNIYIDRDNTLNPSTKKYFHGKNLLDEPEFSFLKDFIVHSAQHFYINTFGCTNIIKITNSWLNICSHNASQALHTHSNSTISGTFYLLFDPTNHPSIVFANPRGQGSFSSVEDFAILNTQFNSSFYRPVYQQNDLLLWPSYLEHGFFASRNESTVKHPRISLSFNMCITNTLLHPYTILRS